MPALKRRSLDLRTFDQLTGDVQRLRDTGYDRVGDWSLEQILDHLDKTMIAGLDGRPGLPRPVRWLLRLVARRLVRTRSMPRVPAPAAARPAPDVDAGVFSRFAATTERAAALPGVTLDHPVFGHFSVYDWQQLQLIHASRHLSFLLPRSAPSK